MDEGHALTVDPAVLSHDARLDALEVLQRSRAAVDAQEQRVLASLAGSDKRVEQWVREEVSVVLRISAHTAAARLRIAHELVSRLPGTVAALASGRVTLPHARALADAVEELTDEAAVKAESRVLGRCAGKSVAEFRADARRTAISVDPRSARQRHEAAVEQRAVTFGPELNGMGSMSAFLPGADIACIRQRVQAHADALGNDDKRTADQKRADVVVDVLLGRDVPGGVPAPVQVIAAMTTLQGLSDEPGELDGEPVTAEVVRQLANTEGVFWRPVLVDDGHGGLIAAGATTYRPGAKLQRLIRLRDRTCRFLGCRRRAVRTEIDHIQPFRTGGPTVAENLHCLYKRHHRLKDENTGWRVARGEDGMTRWTSPTNRHYDKAPEPYPGTGDLAEPTTDTSPDPPPF